MSEIELTSLEILREIKWSPEKNEYVYSDRLKAIAKVNELQAKLDKAVSALEVVANSNYEDYCFKVLEEVRKIARQTLAEIKESK